MLSQQDESLSKKILRYWHQLEFFQPYNLQEKFDSKAIRYCLYPNQLKDENLPWLNPEPLVHAGGLVTKCYRFHLYLGLFDKSELTRLSNELYSRPKEPWESIELEERLDQEGKTCFAKLILDTHGSPEWQYFSVSTLPWAIGRLKRNNHLQIDQASFEVETEVLEKYIAHIPFMKKDQKEIIDANGLFHLFQGLFNWAHFKPEDQPLLAIELQEVKIPAQNNHIEDQNTRLPISAMDHEENGENEEVEIGILNSFYIKDLERIIRDTSESDPLGLYLAGKGDSRVDLTTKKGAAQISHALQPKYAPMGRWPNPVAYYTNVMQQFALNTTLNCLREGGLYSINAPPGTGKTTLVREIIADNIVKRAIALSKLETPKNAFVKSEKISFGNQKQATLSYLDPSLLGYEMLIASSNNTAVENISKELPSKKTMKGNASYLETVANKIAAAHDKFGNVKPLNEGAECWGMISVALGNLRNCQAFFTRGFILKSTNENKYQTFWQWAKNYRGLSFNEAKNQFLEKHAELNKLNASLTEYCELESWFPKSSLKIYTARENEQLQDSEKDIAGRRIEIIEVKEGLAAANKHLFLSVQKLGAIKELKPPWYGLLFEWRRWWDYPKQWKAHHRETLHYLEEVSKITGRLKGLQDTFVSCISLHRKRRKDLAEKKVEFEEAQIRYRLLKKEFSDIAVIPEELNITSSSFHTESFWQNATLNRLRSELFALAMTLHEAWLASVLKRGGGFAGNLIAIGHLLSGKTPAISEATIAIWQSLFMMVPVVSSTFASISRLFRGVTASQIGWLIIDEAGQAIPQAAAGAIWRASRVVVMGDPQQIEPVMTIPPKLADIMGKSCLGESYAKWAPTLMSVQGLADEVNPFGVYIRSEYENTWVGSPLRVHRRCQNPMFQIANEIAYAGGMVQSVNYEENDGLHPSCWYHVPGRAADKQYVVEQGEFVLEKIQSMVNNSKTLPSVYIISPFRQVKDRIRELIGSQLTSFNALNKEELCRWISSRVGTVHTFQGKEDDVVFFVLGADADREGSLIWASQKPNLLNVALTRAKKRVYIIGDIDIWGKKPYFQVATKHLPLVQMG